MERLIQAMRSQGYFQQYSQSLVPGRSPPANLMSDITDELRVVFGGTARLIRQGSSKKRTNVIGSDFDYHIEFLGKRVMVTLQQMHQLQNCLSHCGIDAHMGPTALKVRFQTVDGMEGSIDIVPREASYFHNGVTVEPALPVFHNDIRRQNAARVVKYYVKTLLRRRRRSYDLEMAVLAADRNLLAHDPHGLELFKKTCLQEGYPLPTPQRPSTLAQAPNERFQEDVLLLQAHGRNIERPTNPGQTHATNECFPSDAIVMLADGSEIPVSTLAIGDVVFAQSSTGIVPSEVYAFGHRDPNASTIFCVLETDSGHCLALTPGHLVPVVEKGFVPASKIATGDAIYINIDGCQSEASVTRAYDSTRMGLYAPFTLEGTIIVNGIVTSCYAVLQRHGIFHLAMAPIRALYRVCHFSGILGHAHKGWRLQGAHIYIDLLSMLAPIVRKLRI